MASSRMHFTLLMIKEQLTQALLLFREEVSQASNQMGLIWSMEFLNESEYMRNIGKFRLQIRQHHMMSIINF